MKMKLCSTLVEEQMMGNSYEEVEKGYDEDLCSTLVYRNR